MARHWPELRGHEETVQELFAFVREATQRTNGKLETFFGFAPKTARTTGRDWGRWSNPDPKRRVTPDGKKVLHILRVVMGGASTWDGKVYSLAARQGDSAAQMKEKEDLMSRLKKALAFSGQPGEDHFLGAADDLYDEPYEDMYADEYETWSASLASDPSTAPNRNMDSHLRSVGARYPDLNNRLAHLLIALDRAIHEFGDRQRLRLEAQYRTLNAALNEIREMPRGLVPYQEDGLQQIETQIESSLQAIADLLPFLDISCKCHPAWVCVDVITRYMESARSDALARLHSALCERERMQSAVGLL